MACRAAVKFSLQRKVEYGDRICVVGNTTTLGEWNVDSGRELSWNDGDVWTGEVELPEDEQIEFKLVTVRGSGHQEWDDGDNRTIRGNGAPIDFDLGSGETSLEFNNNGGDDGAQQHHHNDNNGDGAHAPQPYAAYSSSDELDRLPTSAWQGKGPEFMRQNNHSKDRSGKWDTSGLEGTLLALVQGDQDSGRCAKLAALQHCCASVSTPVSTAHAFV